MMFDWIIKHKFLAIILLLFLTGIALLAWILYLPSFNLSVIQRTLNHRDDVTTILTPIMETEVFNNDFIVSQEFEVSVIYDFTSTCLATLLRFNLMFRNGRERGGRFILKAEVIDDRWKYVSGLDITYSALNRIIPELPPEFTCRE